MIRAAFAAGDGAGAPEAAAVAALRDAGALSLSLVAVLDGAIVGHAAFSPVRIGDVEGWRGLAPVSVLPAHQGQGIGNALVRTGLDRLRAAGAAGVVVLGDPGYYARFGFRPVPGLSYGDAPAGVFQAIGFVGALPQGAARYHPAFEAALAGDSQPGGALPI